MHLRDFSAWISVDGVKLNEYSVEVSPNGKEVTCWIASEAGRNFAVNWQDGIHNREVATGGLLKLDGVSCDGRFINSVDMGRLAYVDAVILSESSRRLLCFAPLQLTDDDTHAADHSKDIGKIKLEIWRVEVGDTIPISINKKAHLLASEHKIHERQKKAGVHRIKLGDEADMPMTYFKYSKLDESPYVTFIFRYNPLDVLRANGIAPSVTGQSVPDGHHEPEVKEEDGEDVEDAQEIEALKERLNALEAKRAGRKIVKVEPLSHQGVFLQGEIIDLT